ncbi:hypothetical protein ACKUSY_03315 [Myroides odoratus]
MAFDKTILYKSNALTKKKQNKSYKPRETLCSLLFVLWLLIKLSFINRMLLQKKKLFVLCSLLFVLCSLAFDKTILYKSNALTKKKQKQILQTARNSLLFALCSLAFDKTILYKSNALTKEETKQILQTARNSLLFALCSLAFDKTILYKSNALTKEETKQISQTVRTAQKTNRIKKGTLQNAACLFSIISKN